MEHLKIAIAVLALLAVQGCVSRAQYTPMTQQTHDKIKTVEVYNFIAQDEIRPAVDLMNASGALGGGLIGAMIDSSVNDDRALSARDIAEPLYNATIDHDFRALHADAFSTELATQHRLSDDSQHNTPITMLDKAIERKAQTLAAGEAFLFLTTHYSFIDAFKTLQTSVAAFLLVGEEGKKYSVSKPDFHNTYLYQSAMYGNGGSDSIAMWSADNGALYRQEIGNSIQFIAEKLAQELTPMVDSPCAANVSVATFMFNGNRTRMGTLLAEEGSVSTVRIKKEGQVVFVNNTDVVKNSALPAGCEQGEANDA